MQLPAPYSFGSIAINCYSSIVCITLPNCTKENLEQFTMRWVRVLAGSFSVGIVAGLVDVGFVT